METGLRILSRGPDFISRVQLSYFEFCNGHLELQIDQDPQVWENELYNVIYI